MKHFGSKILSIDKREDVELFVELEKSDETLLKKAVSVIRQSLLESAEDGAVDVELIDITETDEQEKADCDEVIEQVATAQHDAVVLGDTPPHRTTTTFGKLLPNGWP